MFGLFLEHGPFLIPSDLVPVKKDISWTDSYNVLYIDQPAGTGFRLEIKATMYTLKHCFKFLPLIDQLH